MAHEALVDEVLPLQPAVHGLWRDAQPLGTALHGHHDEVDAVVGGSPVVSYSSHYLFAAYQNTATKLQILFQIAVISLYLFILLVEMGCFRTPEFISLLSQQADDAAHLVGDAYLLRALREAGLADTKGEHRYDNPNFGGWISCI